MPLSDHNIYPWRKWIQVREDSVIKKSFEKYLENLWGGIWVDYKTDSGKSTG